MQPKVGPRETIEKLIAAHDSASYGEIEGLVIPGRDTEVVGTLMAVDSFLRTNQELFVLVRDQVSLGAAQAIDQSYLAANLDLFSPFVKLHDVQVEGSTAEVSFSVDGRLPLKHSRLVLLDGRWRYDPGPGYSPDLPLAFERLASGLRLVIDDMKTGRLKPDPDRIRQEVITRLTPGIKLLKPPAASQP